MIFTAAITTPENTPQASAIQTTIPIVFGKITQMLIFFPPGVNALAHIKLLWGLYQLFPSNEQADFAGGDVLIDWPEDIDIETEPSAITAITWNEDDTYPHTITVHIVMTPASGNTNAAAVAQELIAAQSSSTGGQ